tara:strand:- start:3202 stop:3375 length:174 start_codon:yes stop_codon:yes gene_type:complete
MEKSYFKSAKVNFTDGKLMLYNFIYCNNHGLVAIIIKHLIGKKLILFNNIKNYLELN